ncbi:MULTISPECIES: bifunctional adenosylcobinamide kinase/adenosylcobinamide-phosphate guanylyltransferase [unclassified Mycobacterium]|uniref:bifunctional adenosylcobinamide kinase/adenosylcobinamide-phosphate guanylyltransferase n=1 Tax=unclassified Mycobacterium TaxID=2642494 RepID=UPI00073FCEF5|nr:MULTISPECIES: bifunctional adenosylcobinamide kinase/adenosylcobinamide-phosphate guanylyltransferase [unclassified Mycobacterium]KUH83917.1 adenosylcobinamide kinase/adenosylcobinamide phosphate guanyltransferase [Mycobacterium sp. IS-1556]KUH88503.1 adenosylcobinamide kinase/adenosylcobinamide phosphate guanyltransferase [Mycobacterium sp. GA-0227b]KUH89707.1 adenosylcobinamide kinase/adenosylcobinamide phosphate guanyltransferase [Mycobacterium sp. GA-1999]
MRTLVLGGIRSGKSQWAEAALADTGSPPLRYLATGPAPADDPDWAARVAAHRQRRQDRWSTVETADVATQLRTEHIATLVDDIGSWLTAAMDRSGAWTGGSVAADVDDLLDAVGGFSAPLAVVSPEVGLTVVPATAAGRRFADELGSLNQRLAAVCDRVVLVIAGQPVSVKEPV